MRAYIADWQNDLKAQRKVAIQPQPVADPDTPLTPLVQRLKKFIDGLPAELRTQPQSLEFFRQGLRGRQGGKAHAGELGECLRKAGYTRKRGWSVSENGFRALWYPPPS
ncbi:MAG: hypothetical protein Q7T21_15805 [Gallionella sp.]|nr:hypothetical protein [Gallionella sp.]